MLNDSDKKYTGVSTEPTIRDDASVKEIAKRLRTSLRDAEIGRTVVAIQVQELANEWEDRWHSKAGVTLAKWIRLEVDSTRDLSSYLFLAKAAEWTKDRYDRLSSDALAWLARKCEKRATFDQCMSVVSEKYANVNRRRPLSKSQVMIVSRQFIASKAPAAGPTRAELLARIQRLEEQVRSGCKAGTEPVA